METIFARGGVTLVAVVIIALTMGCSANVDGANGDAGGNDSGTAVDGPGSIVDAGPRVDADSCEPPDMLFVLDRTMSMHRRPDGSIPPDTAAGHMASKWYVAIDAIESVSQNLEQTVRFGLELFPIDPGGNVCVTLSERITGTTATNVQCEPGELLVSPDLRTADAIAQSLDPETTRLCRSTPIGGGLGAARMALEAVVDPIREQYAVLLTDGQDTCDEALSLANGQALGDSGVGLYVIGFDSSGGGIDHGHLNDLACAGRTAPDFASNCMDDGNGSYVAVDADNGPALYLLAGDAQQLAAQIEQVAGEVCCNCIERLSH